jgi:hypothetical protein
VARAREGSAGDDVGSAVAVDVAGVGDRVAEPLAGRAAQPQESRTGAAGMDVDPPGQRRRVAGPRGADEDVGRAVVVDVLELAHHAAEVLAGRLAGEDVQQGDVRLDELRACWQRAGHDAGERDEECDGAGAGRAMDRHGGLRVDTVLTPAA